MSSPGKKDVPPSSSKDDAGAEGKQKKKVLKSATSSVNASNTTADSAAATLGSTTSSESTPGTTVVASLGGEQHETGQDVPVEQSQTSPHVQRNDFAFVGDWSLEHNCNASEWSTPTPASEANLSTRGSVDSQAAGIMDNNSVKASEPKEDEPKEGDLPKPEAK